MSKKNNIEAKLDSKILDEFFTAIQIGDHPTVSRLCDSNPTIVNSFDSAGRAPLEAAIQEAKPEIIRTLVKKGANTNHLNQGGEPPLFLVVNSNLENKTEIVRLLINNKADANFIDGSGETALYKAVMNGYVTLVEYLSSHGSAVQLKGALDPLPLAYNKLEEAKLAYKEAFKLHVRAERKEHERQLRHAKNYRILREYGYGGTHPGSFPRSPSYPTPDQVTRAQWELNSDPDVSDPPFMHMKETAKTAQQWSKVVKVLENAAHPSILKQAKTAVVGALRKVSLANSPSASLTTSRAKLEKNKKDLLDKGGQSVNPRR